MKIRCKNCYRVLNKNEEYCTHCGEHSDEMAEYMAEEKHELDATSKFKLSLVIYLCVCFVGTGILMISFALIQKRLSESYETNMCKALSLIITSVVIFIISIFMHFKELKSMFYNGTKKQLLYSLLIGAVSLAILILFNQLTKVTRVIPNYIIDYLKNGVSIKIESFGVSNVGLIVALFLMIIPQEIFFRRRLVDAIDEDTLLGDNAVIVVSALAATLLDFIWVMAPETVLMMFLLNCLMSAIYIYTNRSIGINIILRIILIAIIIII